MSPLCASWFSYSFFFFFFSLNVLFSLWFFNFVISLASNSFHLSSSFPCYTPCCFLGYEFHIALMQGLINTRNALLLIANVCYFCLISTTSSFPSCMFSDHSEQIAENSTWQLNYHQLKCIMSFSLFHICYFPTLCFHALIFVKISLVSSLSIDTMAFPFIIFTNLDLVHHVSIILASSLISPSLRFCWSSGFCVHGWMWNCGSSDLIKLVTKYFT